ncbi:Tripartite tricarboxylate transporter family receptor [compost metagenome]
MVRLTDEIVQSLKQPDVISNLANQNATPGNLTQAQFADLVRAEFTTWGKAVKSSGAKAD